MKKLTFTLVFTAFIYCTQAQQPPVACFKGDSIGSPPCSISFTDLSLNNPTAWGWTFSGGTPGTSIAPNAPGIVFNILGVYTVSLTVTNAFGVDTETKVGVVTFTANTCYFDTTIGTPCTTAVGLEDLVIEDEPISIYPNPTTGQFTVSSRQGAKVEVYDLFGRKVLECTGPEVDMRGYPAGIYIWSIGTARGKVVIE